MFSYDFINKIRKTESDCKMKKCREDCYEQKEKVIIGMYFHDNEQTDYNDDKKQIDYI